MENLYSYVYIFAGYGLGNAVLRYIVLKDDLGEKRGVLGYALSHGTLFNIVLVAVGAAFAALYPHSEEFAQASWLLPIMLAALPLQFVYDSCQLTLRALLKNAAYAACGLLCVAVSCACKISGASLFGLEGAVFALPATYLLMACLLLSIVYRRHFSEAISSKVAKADRSGITSYSLQYMVTNGLWALFMQNDILILGMITGDAVEVANFKVAFAIPAALSIISASIGIVVSPYFIRKEGERRWVWRNYLKVLAAVSALLGSICILVCVFAYPLIDALYGSQYAEIAPLMRLLVVAAFANNAIRYTGANLLAAMGKVKYNMAISSVGMVVQVGLDIFLIVNYGAYGAALSSIAVYALMAAATTICFIKLYR